MVRCRNTISRPRAIGISSPRILAGSQIGWGARDNLLGCNCHSRHPRESGDPVDAGVGVYWFPAFAGMTAVHAAKMIATNPPALRYSARTCQILVSRRDAE